MSLIKIEKIDEVYVRVDCESHIQYELKDYFTFKVPNYQFMPAYRNKLWDGNIYLFNPLTCYLYQGLVSYIYSFAKKRNYQILVMKR